MQAAYNPVLSGQRRDGTKRFAPMMGLTLAALLALTPTPPQAQGSYVNAAHAQALAAFRKGHFSEAYGRFVELAELGHPASARYALWMCEQGPALFDTNWACDPEQVSEWILFARREAPSARRTDAPVQTTRPATSTCR